MKTYDRRMLLQLLIVWNWTRLTLALWNCAQWKPAFQSSSMGIIRDASKAVDGNRASNIRKESCTHTDLTKAAWWMVDLQGQYPVKKIMITNRSDCCSERLKNFRIEIFKTDPRDDPDFPHVTGQICTTHGNSILPGGDNFFTCAPGIVGSFVRVMWQPGYFEALTICELEVLVDSVHTRKLVFDKIYNMLATHKVFLTLTSVDLKKCSLECINRRDMELCTAFNWSPQLHECRLMSINPRENVDQTMDALWILYRITEK